MNSRKTGAKLTPSLTASHLSPPCVAVGRAESHGVPAHFEPDFGVLLTDQQVRRILVREAVPGWVLAEGGVILVLSAGFVALSNRPSKFK